MRFTNLFFFVLFVTIVTAFTLQGQQRNRPFIKVDGEVLTPLLIYADDLLKMTRTEHRLKDFSGLEYTYGGVSLAELMKLAGAMNTSELSGEDLAKYVLVQAADGSEVVFSLADLDANLTDRTIIIADQMNGKPLPQGTGPFRLIIPQDKKRSRWIWEVNHVAVKHARK